MELVDHTTAWAKGEIYQGRIMFFFGLLLLVSFAFIWRSNHEILHVVLHYDQPITND